MTNRRRTPQSAKATNEWRVVCVHAQCLSGDTISWRLDSALNMVDESPKLTRSRLNWPIHLGGDLQARLPNNPGIQALALDAPTAPLVRILVRRVSVSAFCLTTIFRYATVRQNTSFHLEAQRYEV